MVFDEALNLGRELGEMGYKGEGAENLVFHGDTGKAVLDRELHHGK